MLKFTNKKNEKYLLQYLNHNVEFDLKGISLESLEKYQLFESQFNLVESNKQGVILAKLISSYTIQNPLIKLLEEYEISDVVEETVKIPKLLKDSFGELTLEFSQEMMDCSFNDYDKLIFNKKTLAERILKLVSLVTNKKDPETMLIYNNEKGYWEDATIALHRLIIEITHYLGGNIKDTWNSQLEKGIMDILLRKTPLIEPEFFNQGHFPFENVTLNSKTGEMEEHASDNLATFGSPVTYDENAECHVFKKFITELFDDEKTIEFVQEWFGYTLVGNHKANALLIGIGSGANGKSTLFHILEQLVGVSNCSSAPLSNFNTNFGLEPLIGMKLNLATESDAEAFKTGKLKALTAGEKISINRKNKQEIAITLPTKLVFLVNELPIISDSTLGFTRRLIVLPFNNTFPPEKQDKNLPKKLNSELSGILNWSLIGLKRLINNNYHFTISEVMEKTKEEYLSVGNPVEKFVKECIVQESGNVHESKDILGAYQIWMNQNDYVFKGTDSPQKFWFMFEEAAALNSIEYTKGKSSGKTVVRDIGIK